MLNKILVFYFVLECVNAAKILGVFPLPGKSHHVLAMKLMRGLAQAGHDITMISPFRLKDLPTKGKYTDVVLDSFGEYGEKLYADLNLYELELQNPIEKMKTIIDIFTEATNRTLYHPEVKKFLQSNQKFDAVLMEQFSSDALKVFSHVYKCPLIIFCGIGPNAWINPSVGNPQPVAYVTHMFNLDFSREFTFVYKIKNLFVYLADYFLTNYYMHPKHEQILLQAFPDAPPLYDLYTNVSLVLLNSHISLNPAVPMVPNMVEIGGYFIDVPKKLPQDLQDFLDGATDGAIYFSMGSNLKSKDMSKARRTAIFNVFGKLKQKVLWKFEEDLPEKPTNVMIKEWLPQQDILAHPNIRLFITHGGLLSTTETIYHGVPILAIPVFGDQPANAARAVASGIGLQLGYHDPDFTEKRFGDLLSKILNNSKYRDNAQRQSRIYHDRPQKPMETAVYWVEYIIRHTGAPHLRVAGIRMSWCKYFMIDVIGALLSSVFCVLYCFNLIFKKFSIKRK